MSGARLRSICRQPNSLTLHETGLVGACAPNQSRPNTLLTAGARLATPPQLVSPTKVSQPTPLLHLVPHDAAELACARRPLDTVATPCLLLPCSSSSPSPTGSIASCQRRQGAVVPLRACCAYELVEPIGPAWHG